MGGDQAVVVEAPDLVKINYAVYVITSHRTACCYRANFTRVLLYLEVQRHAVVNEGILPGTQAAHRTKSNIFPDKLLLRLQSTRTSRYFLSTNQFSSSSSSSS